MAATLSPGSRKEYIRPIMAAPKAGVTVCASLLFRTLLSTVSTSGKLNMLGKHRKGFSVFWVKEEEC